MAFDVVMFGALSVPGRNVEEWLTTPIEPSAWPWLEEVGGVDLPHDTPEALLSLLDDVACAPHELFSVTLLEGRVEVQCFVREDTFRETSQALALLFASASSFGGVGELHFAGYQGIRFGERLVVQGEHVRFGRVSGPELARLEQLESFRSLDAKIHERFDSLVGRELPEGPLDPRRTRWVVNPFTGRRVRVAALAQ